MAELNTLLQPLNAPVTAERESLGYTFDTGNERNSVSFMHLKDLTLDNLLVGTAQITSAYIADGAITNAKIGSAAIDDSKIGTLTANKISAGTITVAMELGTGNIILDGANKQILINDGTNDRVLIGYQSGGF